MSRSDVQACIGIGANLGEAEVVVRQALAALAALPGIADFRASGLYRTPAWGRPDQPDFINACACFRTFLLPEALLDVLQAIEQSHGRTRLSGERWGPRTLDLDLLLYGDVVIASDRLQVPHPWMHERAFVLLPLAQIAPQARVPGQGRVVDLLATIDASAIRSIGG